MDKLVRERKSLYPRVNRISDVVDSFNTETVEEIDIHTELDTLNDIWALYSTVNKKIVNVCEDDSDYENAVDDQCNFERNYVSLKTRLLKMLKIVKDRENNDGPKPSNSDIIKQLADQQAEFLRLLAVNMSTPSTSNTASTVAITPASPLSDLKLPRMNIPIFSGNYLEWQSFHDLFDSLVHKNPTLSDSQRLYFLKINLAGEAASLISHLKIEDANYAPALQKLRSRYDKPLEIANKHIQRFLSQPCMTMPSAQTLRSLHDVSDEVIRALKAMNKEDRDTWLLYMLLEKVDSDTKQLWYQKTSEMNEVDISLQAFLTFIESRSFALQSAHPITQRIANTKPFAKPQHKAANAFVATNPPSICNVCSKQSHHLYQCGKFLHMKPEERLSAIDRLNLCKNCLKQHLGQKCRSGSCRKCGLFHHTMLHIPAQIMNEQQVPVSTIAPANSDSPAQVLISARDSKNRIDASNVLLATVAINVLDKHGRPHTCRAVLDCASQLNFISESFCKELGIDTKSTNMHLEGIASTPTHADRCTQIIISSRCTEYRASVPCVVLKKVTGILPSKPADIDDWPIPGSIHLADPLFHCPGEVSILLGTELFFQLLEPGKIALSLDDRLPTLQNTKLGWIVAGRYHDSNSRANTTASTYLTISAEDPLSQQRRKFWELEEYSAAITHFNEEEQRCEQEFATTSTSRDEAGKFIGRSPVLHNPSQLSNSRQIAERTLNHIEKRLDKDHQFKLEYPSFMQECLELGHMSLSNTTASANSVYLPHQSVKKASSTTTKCRVDATANTTSGQTLNDTTMCGPVSQNLPISIFLQFRVPSILLISDILRSGAARLNNFAANRVAEINTCLPAINWYHIGTHGILADGISREASPVHFKDSHIWWYGPTRDLSTLHYRYRERSIDIQQQRQFNREEQATVAVCSAAYNKHEIATKSPLHQLSPFIVERDLVRVGGRLQQCDLSYDEKQKELLPSLFHQHHDQLHCGPQSLLAATRRRYWTIRGTNTARKKYRSCVHCAKLNTTPSYQQMGQLSADQLKPVSLIVITGVDYAGPVSIIGRRTRNTVEDYPWNPGTDRPVRVVFYAFPWTTTSLCRGQWSGKLLFVIWWAEYVAVGNRSNPNDARTTISRMHSYRNAV